MKRGRSPRTCAELEDAQQRDAHVDELWEKAYKASLQRGMKDRAARGQANRALKRQLHISPRAIQQARKRHSDETESWQQLLEQVRPQALAIKRQFAAVKALITPDEWVQFKRLEYQTAGRRLMGRLLEGAEAIKENAQLKVQLRQLRTASAAPELASAYSAKRNSR